MHYFIDNLTRIGDPQCTQQFAVDVPSCRCVFKVIFLRLPPILYGGAPNESERNAMKNSIPHLLGRRDAKGHGGGVRGSDLARRSSQFEGRFGRMFRTLPAAEFSDED